jgi:hypothetical protein
VAEASSSAAAEELFAGISGRGWRRDPWLVVAEATANPDALTDSGVRAIVANSHTALAAIPFVPDDHLFRVATAVMERLQQLPTDKLAHRALTALAWQSPACLDPWLVALFDLGAAIELEREAHHLAKTWDSTIDERDPDLPGTVWRGASDATVTALEERATSANPTIARLAKVALVNSMRPKHWRPAAPNRNVPFAAGRAVCAPRAFHLAFPKGFLKRSGGLHPTNAPATEGRHVFGGEGVGTCPLCHGQNHHLLTIDPVPDGLGVSLAKLSLETCLACCGWAADVLFHVHAADGSIAAHTDPTLGAHTTEDDEPAELEAIDTLATTKVGLVDAGPRWRHQPWESNQNLAKLGGEPTWVQEAHYPICPECGRTMSFLAQLPSGLPQDGGEFDWGSGGLAFGFWCDGCRVSAWHWQNH